MSRNEVETDAMKSGVHGADMVTPQRSWMLAPDYSQRITRVGGLARHRLLRDQECGCPPTN